MIEENKEDLSIIESIKEFMEKCPEISKINDVDIIDDKIDNWSISKATGFKSKIDGTEDILGNYDCQYLFNLDANLIWNEENHNNIDNLISFEKIEKWLNQKNQAKEYPELKEEGCRPFYIGTVGSGYIYNTNYPVATYRISCVLNYRKEVELWK